jgi:predicted dinucleotide-binding enzyme
MATNTTTDTAKKRIAIIGRGHVGGALARGLGKAGHDVRAVGRDQEAARRAVSEAELVFLAVPYLALDATLDTLGNALGGKSIVDVTNPLTKDRQLALGFTTSGAEELQKKLPEAKIVKAFNMVFAQTMDSGHAKGQQLTVFAAGDDESTKAAVLALARDIGFEAIDAGPLRNARLLEPLSYLNIQLGHALGFGTDAGFKFIH